MNTETTISENTYPPTYSAKEMRRSSNGNSLILIIFIIAMFGGSILVGLVLGLFMDTETKLYENTVFLTRMLFQYIIGVPAALIIYKITPSGRNTEKLGSLFCKPQQSFWWVARWVLITIFFSYATSIATNLLFMFLQSVTGVELYQTNLAADETLLSKFANIICIVILAPIFEEILIRGGMLSNTKRYGTWSAIISTGIFFGLLHMNYPQVPFASVMGVCSAFMVLKTKSIIPSITAHFCINLAGGIQSLFMGDFDLSKIQSYDIDYMKEHLVQCLVIMGISCFIMLLSAAGLVLFILEIIMHKESFRLDPVCPEVSEKKKLAVYFSAPLTILLTLFLIVMTVLNAIPAK